MSGREELLERNCGARYLKVTRNAELDNSLSEKTASTGDAEVMVQMHVAEVRLESGLVRPNQGQKCPF